jgi:hypothetical protein
MIDIMIFISLASTIINQMKLSGRKSIIIKQYGILPEKHSSPAKVYKNKLTTRSRSYTGRKNFRYRIRRCLTKRSTLYFAADR